MSVLVATDLSTKSAAALRYAEDVAARLDTALTILHVAPDTRADIAEDAQHALDMFLREYVASPERHDARVVVGDTHASIVAAADGHDLLVCGATGSSYIDDIFLGSTASRLIRAAPCPVIVVPDAFEPSFEHIVVANGLDAASRAALNLAEDLAAASKATLWLLHAVPDSASEAVRSDTRQRLDALAHREFDVKVRLESGDPAHAIRKTVADVGADLVVMGTNGRDDEARYLLGSVAERVVRRPPCPVATVRPFSHQENSE